MTIKIRLILDVGVFKLSKKKSRQNHESIGKHGNV